MTIQEQLEILRKDVATLTQTLGEYGKAQKEAAAASARSKAEQLRSDAEAGLHEAEERARRAYAGAEAKVQENPGAALAIAGGVGFLIGLFMSRR
ncbi:DUF883 family protein [Pseudooceanicola sp. CBS1P-1]|uniref:DUF883 family protein n=1 Tax=Pseudooceanicola albus TaxID=2692189 RepID=A0A6L7GAH1_9RHOB|nr:MULTISPECIES: DUF883 family protein [Pseudooceanicola]MBT9386505.1 DUF883 family protein [Pseudooceanicola endophyticus]MXN20538.1 DUF883 family protein [Pseudooceanicola albus]